MSDPRRTRPRQITPFPNGEIGIVWEDDHETYFDGHDLRCACACATCVDEVSGHKILRDDEVPKDVHVREIHRVGRYGVSFVWSDGHDVGIYAFERLRSMCPCGECGDSD